MMINTMTTTTMMIMMMMTATRLEVVRQLQAIDEDVGDIVDVEDEDACPHPAAPPARRDEDDRRDVVAEPAAAAAAHRTPSS